MKEEEREGRKTGREREGEEGGRRRGRRKGREREYEKKRRGREGGESWMGNNGQWNAGWETIQWNAGCAFNVQTFITSCCLPSPFPHLEGLVVGAVQCLHNGLVHFPLQLSPISFPTLVRLQRHKHIERVDACLPQEGLVRQPSAHEGSVWRQGLEETNG